MTTLPSMVLETAVSESVAELIELGKRIWVRGGCPTSRPREPWISTGCATLGMKLMGWFDLLTDGLQVIRSFHLPSYILGGCELKRGKRLVAILEYIHFVCQATYIMVWYEDIPEAQETHSWWRYQLCSLHAIIEHITKFDHLHDVTQSPVIFPEEYKWPRVSIIMSFAEDSISVPKFSASLGDRHQLKLPTSTLSTLECWRR